MHSAGVGKNDGNRGQASLPTEEAADEDDDEDDIYVMTVVYLLRFVLLSAILVFKRNTSCSGAGGQNTWWIGKMDTSSIRRFREESRTFRYRTSVDLPIYHVRTKMKSSGSS